MSAAVEQVPAQMDVVSSEVDQKSPEYVATRRAFTEFLDAPELKQRLIKMVGDKKCRLPVHIDELRVFNLDLAGRVLQHPLETLPPFEDALVDVIRASDELGAKNYLEALENSKLRYHIAIDFSSEASAINPRTLSSSFLTRTVCVEGIVTRCSVIRPKIVQSVHFCPETGKFHQKDYHDATSLIGHRTTSSIPTRDEHGNLLEMEYGLCTYKNHQSVTIQEMPEKAPKGQLPCSVDVLLDDDLADSCKPGDRVQIVGIFRALSSAKGTASTGQFRTLIIANNVKNIGGANHKATSQLTRSDIEEIRRIANRKDHFSLLSHSLAPSIHGHEIIKKALVLMLFGGAEKNLATGTHIRGDINILVIGDPSTAKSQMLRAIMNSAPLAISTTGRGSTGVGLTAAVVQDKDTGDRRLEAGAMVLADRGVVCIDEFDKMSDADRVAIHEVMEQQTVTIAKAGIHTSLNARCSVLAAANPIYGKYDDTIEPNKNIGLPDSLLSRFDLLFVVLDNLDSEKDSRIADHVIRLHKYQNKTSVRAAESKDKSSGVFEKYNKQLHGPVPIEILSNDFLQKYILFAKQRRVVPKLTDEAIEYIAEEYTQLRDSDSVRTLPITARLLETIIRLSTAHAKTRLSNSVDVTDCETALDILKYALYHEVGGALVPQHKALKGKKMAESDDEQADVSEGELSEGEARQVRETRRTKSKRKLDDSEEIADKKLKQSTASRLSGQEGIKRMNELRKGIVKFQLRTRRESFSVNELLEFLNKDEKNPDNFGLEEVSILLQRLEDMNHLMHRDGEITLISN